MTDERRVGLTYIRGTVTGPTGETAALDFLIDSGANYTLLPEEAWRRLGLAPDRTQGFRLADGTRIERAISECHIAVAGRHGHTPVILGEAADRALLGVITLEELGLVFNPFDGSLRPMEEASLMPLTA